MELEHIGTVVPRESDSAVKYRIFDAPLAWTTAGIRKIDELARPIAGVQDVTVTTRVDYTSVVTIDVAGKLPSGSKVDPTTELFWRRLNHEMSTWTEEDWERFVLTKDNDSSLTLRKENLALYGEGVGAQSQL